MQELDLSLTILNDVIDNDVTFADSLKNKFQADVAIRPMRANVAGLVGCALRHQILFDYLTKDLTDFTVQEKRIVALCLANDYFYRHFEAEAIDAATKEALGEEKFAAIAPLLEKVSKPEEYIPADIQRASNTYLSLRYNTPEWVLKVMEHFGYSNTYRTLREFARPATYYLRARAGFDAASLGDDLIPTPVEGIYAYKGKTPLRKVDAYRKGQLFDEKPFIKWLVDQTKVEEPSEIFLYDGSASEAFSKELIETYGASIGMNIACPDVDKKFSVTKAIKEKDLHNVNFFSAPDVEMMDAAISHPQDLAIVVPDATNFDLIPFTPDYLLHFNKDGMDAMFENQRKALNSMAKYVALNGKLVYAIPTISRKEGSNLIKNFLRFHPEFALVEEKQRFPFDELHTAFYYAILVKTGEPVTAEPPINELNAASPAAVSGFAASGK
ncbi:MAG: hypothetical protein K6F32_04990 [Bacilli bacterium]|nr:hypothetical protein [Bacilli bacterium]